MINSNTVPEALPFIDVHGIEVGGSPERTWQGLVALLSGLGSAQAWQAFATAVGSCWRRASGPAATVGSTVPGFSVTESDPPRTLRLRGSHRFSDYELVFRIEPTTEGCSLLRAESRALFPGVPGKIYRMLVIGSGAHVLAVEAMLRRIKRTCERLLAPP